MTPFLGGIFALLLTAQVVRGWLEGVIQPVILSVQARAVGCHQQGAVVGLRQTGQRLTSILVPPLIGGVADRWGTGESFVIFGASLLLLCIPLGVMVRRAARCERLAKAQPSVVD
jgi:MFS family permease